MKKLAVVGFKEKRNVLSFVQQLENLKQRYPFNFDLFLYEKRDFELYDILGEEVNIKKYDAAISIGGDGTFLYTARIFAGSHQPIFGVNIGRIGFNAKIEIKDFEFYLKSWLEETLEYEYVDLLDVKIDQHEKIFTVVNEGVISHNGISRIIHLKVSSQGHLIYDFRGDGVIVSTSTGSTAYNLSAGGPILHPSVKAISLSPICAHTLAIRPYIIPIEEGVTIEIAASSVSPQLTLDGQKTILLTHGEKIIFKKSKKNIKIVKTKKIFSEILKEKLGWNT